MSKASNKTKPVHPIKESLQQEVTNDTIVIQPIPLTLTSNISYTIDTDPMYLYLTVDDMIRQLTLLPTLQQHHVFIQLVDKQVGGRVQVLLSFVDALGTSQSGYRTLEKQGTSLEIIYYNGLWHIRNQGVGRFCI